MSLKPLAAVLIGLTLFASPQAQFDTAKIDQLLDRLHQKNKGMGSLTLTKDGTVVYSHSFGYSYVNGADKRPATETTKYRIASIGKTYTAVMIFQLIEEGKLKLSDSLYRFFPEIPNATKITIAHMLQHRSGIHDMEPDGSWGHEYRTPDEVLSRIAAGKPDFEPDTKTQYSNAGYYLLGRIVEKAGGKPYPDALADRITSKIGLANTYSVGRGGTDAAKNEALSYGYRDGYQAAREIDFSITPGAGSILSTPTDMARFIQAVFDLKLVSSNSLKMMTTLRDDEGMGLIAFTFAGRSCFGNTGGSFSTGAWLTYCPDEKLTLAYATNMKIYPVAKIVSGIFDIYWNRPFEIPTFDAFEVSPEILDRYVGVYATEGAPNKLTISRKGNTLYFQPGSQSAVSLEAMSETRFKIDPGVFFEFDALKGTMKITRPQGERVFTKEK